MFFIAQLISINLENYFSLLFLGVKGWVRFQSGQMAV